MTPDLNNKRIILSRTDSIGDVILTLPMAGVLKKLFPDCTVIFLGSTYTRPVIEVCEHVDEFADWKQIRQLAFEDQKEVFEKLNADLIIHVFPVKEIARLAKAARIPVRTGTTNRLWHWFTCNDLTRLSRKNSPYHEAQLNLKLLRGWGAKDLYSRNEIPAYYGFNKIARIPDELNSLIDPTRFNLILHPRSKGSSKEWSMENYIALVGMLPQDQFRLFISGTEKEMEHNRVLSEKFPFITNLTGKLSLPGLIGFISIADGLLAASTGPLHIAAACGKYAIGLYPGMRPLHPGRWAPLGKNAAFIEEEIMNTDRHAPLDIRPESVGERLMEIAASKKIH